MLRVVYLLALLAVIWSVYQSNMGGRRINIQADVAERFVFMILAVQNLAILLLSPLYFAGAIAEERERKTLELLFVSQMRDGEILFGKLWARVLHLGGIMLASLPVLSIAQVLGGVDMAVLVANYLNSFLLLVGVGSVSLLVSVLSRSMTVAVLASYGLIVPGICLVMVMADSRHPFVLLPEAGPLTMGSASSFYESLWLSLLKLSAGYVVVTVSSWLMGLRRLRGFRAKATFVPLLRGAKLDPLNKALPKLARTAARDLRSLERQMPPIGDNAFLWKEKYQGSDRASCARILWPAMLPFVCLSWIALVAAIEGSEEMVTLLLEAKPVVRMLVFALIAYLCLEAALRSTASVALERQQQTLDMLLVLPVERREILHAKWRGCLWRAGGWYPLLASVLLLGACTGSIPYWGLLSLVFGTLHVMFFNSLGIYLSVISASVMAARFKMMVAIFVVVSCGGSYDFLIPRGGIDYLGMFLTYGVNPVGTWNFISWNFIGGYGGYAEYIRNERLFFVQNIWIVIVSFCIYFSASTLLMRQARRRFERLQN